ncbi:hypothetical protein AMECASPLE_022293 [Ameca splendens]|uniref:Uncharacterized protein n=1 Tax=Ameca splendens TaxID=208324 RepID=A0ABV0Y436_9TELE
MFFGGHRLKCLGTPALDKADAFLLLRFQNKGLVAAPTPFLLNIFDYRWHTNPFTNVGLLLKSGFALPGPIWHESIPRQEVNNVTISTFHTFSHFAASWEQTQHTLSLKHMMDTHGTPLLINSPNPQSA